MIYDVLPNHSLRLWQPLRFYLIFLYVIRFWVVKNMGRNRKKSSSVNANQGRCWFWRCFGGGRCERETLTTDYALCDLICPLLYFIFLVCIFSTHFRFWFLAPFDFCILIIVLFQERVLLLLPCLFGRFKPEQFLADVKPRVLHFWGPTSPTSKNWLVPQRTGVNA